MKFIGNIICTIAIFAQVLLSAGLLTHAPDCAAAMPVTVSGANITDEMLSDHSGCDHRHAASEANDHCVSLPPAPDHDCTCTPQKTYPYVLSEYIAEQKSKEHLLVDNALASTHIDFSKLSSPLCKANQSNAPPSSLSYLPQHQTRYASIHLGVYLI